MQDAFVLRRVLTVAIGMVVVAPLRPAHAAAPHHVSAAAAATARDRYRTAAQLFDDARLAGRLGPRNDDVRERLELDAELVEPGDGREQGRRVVVLRWRVRVYVCSVSSLLLGFIIGKGLFFPLFLFLFRLN